MGDIFVRTGAGVGGNQRSKCVTSKNVNMLSLKRQLPKHLFSSLTFYSKRFTKPERNQAWTQSPTILAWTSAWTGQAQNWITPYSFSSPPMCIKSLIQWTPNSFSQTGSSIDTLANASLQMHHCSTASMLQYASQEKKLMVQTLPSRGHKLNKPTVLHIIGQCSHS